MIGTYAAIQAEVPAVRRKPCPPVPGLARPLIEDSLRRYGVLEYWCSDNLPGAHEGEKPPNRVCPRKVAKNRNAPHLMPRSHSCPQHTPPVQTPAHHAPATSGHAAAKAAPALRPSRGAALRLGRSCCVRRSVVARAK
jgi:hypothetical protein